MATKNEVVIAAIGFAGILVTGILSNYDKIFATESSEYESSNDINLQARNFVEISGMRAGLEVMEKQRIEKLKWKYNASPETIDCMMGAGIQTSQLIDLTVDVLKKHLTLKELKELNEFHSSPSMRHYIDQQAAISKDLIDGIETLAEKNHIRNLALALNNEKNHATSTQSCPTK
ncbi:DUF2059 domain-containing protein [Pseudomonas resinovorans]|uniref:DUF2059 domain-containing protein n=1 Tax=Metapseudomonas resinovorans TaxID=53412 RepID=A0ABT4Y1B4_METRE|nr:DUF2059 domain-containing protein [Pseudomonas resinovorans]MDA8482630.1 DUF2059 domain-containing protein [Pseudomonas resinovorans]